MPLASLMCNGSDYDGRQMVFSNLEKSEIRYKFVGNIYYFIYFEICITFLILIYIFILNFYFENILTFDRLYDMHQHILIMTSFSIIKNG